jgi:hypothetical protein
VDCNYIVMYGWDNRGGSFWEGGFLSVGMYLIVFLKDFRNYIEKSV